MLSAVPDSKQFNISLSPDLKKRLGELASRFNKGKATKVGAEIIETYVERWAELELLKEQLQDAQAKQMADDLRDHVSRRHPPLVTGGFQNDVVSHVRKRRK
jgi:predicted DNA-binding protein